MDFYRGVVGSSLLSRDGKSGRPALKFRGARRFSPTTWRVGREEGNNRVPRTRCCRFPGPGPPAPPPLPPSCAVIAHHCLLCHQCECGHLWNAANAEMLLTVESFDFYKIYFRLEFNESVEDAGGERKIYPTLAKLFENLIKNWSFWILYLYVHSRLIAWRRIIVRYVSNWS